MKAILFALAALTGSTFAEPLDIYADAVKGRETFVLHGKRYTGTASLVDQLHKTGGFKRSTYPQIQLFAGKHLTLHQLENTYLVLEKFHGNVRVYIVSGDTGQMREYAPRQSPLLPAPDKWPFKP